MTDLHGLVASPQVDPDRLKYHLDRFKRWGIPLVRSGGSETSRVVLIDPMARLPRQYVGELTQRGYHTLVINQRTQGDEYFSVSDSRQEWYINLWPKGSQLPDGVEHVEERLIDEELLPWSSAIAEDAVAASQLFGARVAIGVDPVGGIIAAEVGARLGMKPLVMLSNVYGAYTRYVVDNEGSALIDALTQLWAEASALRAADRVLLSGALVEKAREVVHLYGDQHTYSINTSPIDFGIYVRRMITQGMRVLEESESIAYHRATQVWRGDLPRIQKGHKKAARHLFPYLMKWKDEAKEKGRRLIITCGGESGSGKTEIASYLQLLLHLEGVGAAMIPGDAFFKRAPSDNHAHRVALYEKGEEHLKKFLMSEDEIDYTRLDNVLLSAMDRRNDTVYIPSDARRIDVVKNEKGERQYQSRRYDRTPVWLAGVDVVFVDLTTSARLENADVRVMYSHDYTDKLEHIRARNLGRDPDQDFGFIENVLRLEHEIIAPLKAQASVLFDRGYNIQVNSTPTFAPVVASTLPTTVT